MFFSRQSGDRIRSWLTYHRYNCTCVSAVILVQESFSYRKFIVQISCRADFSSPRTLVSAMSADNLMISDKVWILVGMLLRNGRSCTPSELANFCHVWNFTSSEIDWLCKLPFSPLCLSLCGQVTFSQFVLEFFDIVRNRYAKPSVDHAAWKYCFDCDSISSILLPLTFSQKLYQPSLKDKRWNVKTSNNSFPNNAANCNSQEITGEKPQKLEYFRVRQYSRKRLRYVELMSPTKKQKISTFSSRASKSKRMKLHGSDKVPLSLLCSTEGHEIEGSCASNLSVNVRQPSHQDHVTLRDKGHVLRITDHLSCYSQQSCTATVTYAREHTECGDQVMFPSVSLVNLTGVDDSIRDERQEIPIIVTEPRVREENPGILVYRSVSRHFKQSVQDSPMKKQGCMHNHENAGQVEMDTEIVQNAPLFFHGEDCPPGNQAKDITICVKKSIHAANQSDEQFKGNCTNDQDTIGGRSLKLKGKSTKGTLQKNLNRKQVTKLRELKKTSGPCKELHTAGCSAVTGTFSNQLTEDKFPSFDGFIVEAIEGSGGYGTVYKAMKKDGGKLVAIKYPFERTSSRHVQNEIKVLQRYGGHSFIPKCLEVVEESGKQCLVLDYIEHEKPEVLKKEITVSELKFYALSLFKALVYLHSKGIIHRDVKPGNFLFSREKKCGWLIDFNLATGQSKPSSSGKYQKQGQGRLSDRPIRHESHQHNDATLSNLHKSPPHHQSVTHNHSGKAKLMHSEFAHHHKNASTPSGTPTHEIKFGSATVSQSKKHTEFTSQQEHYKLQTVDSGAEISLSKSSFLPPGRVPSSLGDTMMSSKITVPDSGIYRGKTLQSDEKQRGKKVLPRYGRRELWELVQNSQPANQSAVSSIPSSQKKRVAAPQKRKHQKLTVDLSLQQMDPLSVSKYPSVRVSNINQVKAGGMLKVRNGPCAGTKGYRAPEVLLKSLFQTEKIDVWSAGVSLFQLILGKSPFSSSSNLEQSLLDIAQFCGTEAICALAKDHKRESSLPKELLESKAQPIPLSLWFEKHTKRQNIQPVPSSLFDLLEKCLRIDPKNRISAKEALQHEFFRSSHDSLSSVVARTPHVTT
ncbi:hypothetical protein KP509_27G063000 [Ceratopteris richardii]|uniref:Protein kinase domain-containing protein n=1 Tax=Ceratopteris richardii TaxID=49495 RepID=A0A8T2RIE5_CERRI|nr:hypothetical protein KP509_27G063000 [Ceratopteris richardii]